jgi:hypothetical protein
MIEVIVLAVLSSGITKLLYRIIILKEDDAPL